jgi:hypothetical protein
MLCDTYQGGGTVAAATPPRVGNMDAALLPVTPSSANPLPIGPSRTGIFGESDPSMPLKCEMKDQSDEK